MPLRARSHQKPPPDALKGSKLAEKTPCSSGSMSKASSSSHEASHIPLTPASDVLLAWKRSRLTPSEDSQRSVHALRSGAPRPFNVANVRIALFLLWRCWLDVVHIVLSLHPTRMPLMIILNVVRGALPAYQSYAQAVILDEVQRAISSGSIWGPQNNVWSLIRLILFEAARMFLGRLLDRYIEFNSSLVQQSVRLRFQYLQLQTRLRLDIQALADPLVQDLLDESNKFVNSFASGSNTILTPIGMMSLVADLTQLSTQLYILASLLYRSPSAGQLVTIGCVVIPRFPAVFRRVRDWFISSDDDWPDEQFESRATSIKQRISQMEDMAYSVTFKAEVMLLGLADWILEQWLVAKQKDMELDQTVNSRGVFVANQSSRTGAAIRTFLNEAYSEVYDVLRNIPFIIQYSNASMGSANLTRTATERLCRSLSSIRTAVRWSFDSCFDLGAFHCAMKIQPYLNAAEENRLSYQLPQAPCSQQGMKLELKDLEFSFPGQHAPTLHGVHLTVNPGETVAIVGLNGSGKTTLMHVLARLVDFSDGSYCVNDVDVRRFDASNLHKHMSVIFQSFCKFERTSVRENVGVGSIKDIDSDDAVSEALRASGALSLVRGMECGMETLLEGEGNRPRTQMYPHYRHYPDYPPPPYAVTTLHAYLSADADEPPCPPKKNGVTQLSGGQWQRIAISRALMRVNTYDLMLIDEANSALDLCGQRQLFQGLTERPGHGTIIFVTHRLDALQWADKVAIMENGTITAFGPVPHVISDIRRVFELNDDDALM